MEGVELSIERSERWFRYIQVDRQTSLISRPFGTPLIPLSCNHLARYRNGQIGDNVRRFVVGMRALAGSSGASPSRRPRRGFGHDQESFRCMSEI